MNTRSRSMLLLAPAFAVTAALSACVPHHLTDAPAVAGQVVSGATNRPVAGAVVSVTSGKNSVQTRTDQAGSFHLPAITSWGLIPYPTDGISDGHGILRVEAAGYAPYTEEVVSTSSALWRSHTEAELKHLRVSLDPGSLTTHSSEPALRSGR